MADKARQKTDKILNDIEGAISTLYANSPELKRAGEKYVRYMQQVDKRTRKAREAFLKEEDKNIRAELQAVYEEQARSLTQGSAEYQRIVTDFCYQLALVNQQALDIVNDNMSEIYMINYNQVAEECRRVGIEVRNG